MSDIGSVKAETHHVIDVDTEHETKANAETQLDDQNMLKRKRTTALRAVTRCRNKLAKLMLDEDNLHEVKTELNEYDQLFLHYQEAHELYLDALLSEDEQDKATKQYYDHENSIRDFHEQTAKWILEAEG